MKVLLSLILIFHCFYSTAQNFEGFISYETSYNSKSKNISTKEVFGQEVSMETTYFKDGYYLQISTSDFMHYLLWRSEDTTQYFKNKSTSDTIWFEKTNSNPSRIDSFFVEKKADTILGYSCDKLTTHQKGKTIIYYYHPNFKLNPKFYTHYTNVSKYDVMKIMQSPYLRLQIITPSIEVDMVATKIKIYELENSIFEIPENGVLQRY